jgi:dTDP-glucose pyrophosphorylase
MADVDDLWRRTLVTVEAPLRHVIETLIETSLRIVLIVDQENRFIGTISDGDIRRGLLVGLNLESSIATIVHHDAVTVRPETGQYEVTRLMLERKIQQIPIIDEFQHVVGLHLWDEVSSMRVRPNTVVVMAGGYGTRLHPHTNECPKPMLLVAGKPMLEHIIERARDQGLNNFVIAVHFLGHIIEDYFGDGKRFGVRISYVREKTPLGTVGALKLLDPPPNESIVVINGDIISEIQFGDLLDYHERNGAAATMVVRAHVWQNPFGVVKINGCNIIGFEEKPTIHSFINAGVYVLEPDTMELLDAEVACDMPVLFSRLKADNRQTIVFPLHERWSDVGRIEDLSF